MKVLGVIVMVAAAGALAYSLSGKTRSIYLPGPTTSGHYQIELACDSCHKTAFSGEEALQEACVECHGEELKAANDSHPESKFTDPRNADRVAKLNARLCVTCHREHRPELVSKMGLSLPEDYCFRCHETIGDERKSHASLAFDTCADAGCHNFHDNRALYEDFLEKHLDEPATLLVAKNPERHVHGDEKALALAAADAPSESASKEAAEEWAASAHAHGGVNCSDCHAPEGKWSDSVSGDRCGECHEDEREGFLGGRHGMRLAQGLSPMRVGDARQPMKPSAADHTLGCTSCHGSHRFDTRLAAVDACLGCHADEHSKNYEGTKHAALWRADPTGQKGASCATCHLPRLVAGDNVSVQHNQNDTLRPSEKMVRPICLNCHGVGFSLASLVNERLVANNFADMPSGESRSIEMVRERLAAH